ncbi:MAG TPA: DNA mismatch repair endonuclease MutL [Desulfuromonadales bacterium]|nr:DNA mismatch repair endonuclease MutL [Desulfuromonadales bacterium]
MAPRITILSETVTNKIAAGEVVERPASVIKELVENSLDARATDITIEITGGGKRRICVTDNGHGMSREDALLSLERHATSKITSDSDLDSILTLGFRGEALPSIASVSRFTLATREAAHLEGTEISVEGGRIRDVRACGMPTGTALTIEHLFFNTPARLKFMKSNETENGHVGDVVSRMAVSRPDAAFLYVSDGRELLRLQPGDLRRRFSQVVGKETSSQLFEIHTQSDHASISGFISGPAAARSGPNGMFTYINGRFIRDKVVQHAIMQAYRGVIDRGRYPVVALFIELPPDEVDVNVHPTKHEVRFRRQTLIHDSILEAVAEVLRTSPWLSHHTIRATKPLSALSQTYRERVAQAAQTFLAMPSRSFSPAQNFTTAETRQSTTTGIPPETVHETTVSFAPENDTSQSPGYFSSLTFIGQLQREYLLCQSANELVIIDQHAASERVAFQNLKKEFLSGAVESQRLLFPETLELSFSEVATAERFRHDLTTLGFELEPFGGNTLVVAAIPRIAAEKDPLGLVRDILEGLTQLGTTTAFANACDELLSRIACHTVIRGAHYLDSNQAQALLFSMDQTDFAASCPHGRPVSHSITLRELEKIFKRT